MSSEVLVTRAGVVTPLGVSIAEFEEALFAGNSGVRAIRGHLVPEAFPVPYAAWIPRERLRPSRRYGNGRVPKSWQMTEDALLQALQGVEPRFAIDAAVYGTADGVTYEMVEAILKSGLPGDFDYRTTRSESSLEVIQDVIEGLGFARLSERNLISVNGACASGNQAIGIAFEGIRDGRWRRCLVGGVDARCEASNLLNFHQLGALTTAEVPPETASRPFSRSRSGFVRGEGAAVLLLESREAAEERGAEVLGVVSGYGCTSDAYRLTDGREDGAPVREAMERALRSAALPPGEIDAVNAHGTSTPLNDRLETLAIKGVFGDLAYRIPVNSLKSQIGHSTIAASAIEAVACLLMLRRQAVSPTLNCNDPDPECDLDYVPNASREVALRHILSNSFGFGGQNACVVFSRAERRP